MAEFQIRDLKRVDGHWGRGAYWTARIVQGRASLRVDCKYGSWQVVKPDGSRTDVLPRVAAALQAKARRTKGSR